MANQPTKYRKFVVGAASAALVASAVAPVASAASFTDVADNNSHKASIDALVAKGVISGYPDGSFQPNKTLTRSDVVKMMGKWLKAEGYSVPTDYKTNPRFADLTSASNDELLQMAALVKDNGLFVGTPDGKLDPAGNITRENMAIVIVRAFDRVHNIDLATYVAGQEFKKDVVDLAQAKAEARPAIDVLDYFDITNPANPTFDPKGTTTRAQFASFLNKAIETDYSEVGTGVVGDATVKAVNATTVEVTFKDAVENINSLNFTIEGLTVSNAAVKQSDNKTVVLTTAVQEGGKEYTVSLNKEEIGKFTGVSAVIPTKIDITTQSVQGKVGQQAIVSADVGVKQAGIPVTFNVKADTQNTLNKDQVFESLTNEDGIATFSYTQYAAGTDSVVAYPTGAPTVRSLGYVFWGVDTILSIEEVTKGDKINNGANKTYKVTYKNPETGKPEANRTFNVSALENIGVTADKLQNVSINGVEVSQLSNNTKTEAAQITTDSKGEATFTVSGTNSAVTPVVYGLNTTTGENSKTYKASSLQATASKVTFGAVQADYSIELTREGGEVAATGVTNGREYKVIVKDKEGKVAKNEIVNVAFNEDLDRVISTNTDAQFIVNKAYAGKQISVKTDSKGEAKFVIGSNTVNAYATPIAWIDINTSNAKQGDLDEGEPKAVAPITYFQEAYLDGAAVKSYLPSDLTETVTEFKGNETAIFRAELVNQSGKKMPGTSIKSVTYTIFNTGANDIKVGSQVISPNRSYTVSYTEPNTDLYVTSIDKKTTSVKVVATGIARNTDGKDYAFTSKEAEATFTSTTSVGTEITERVVAVNKTHIEFVGKDPISLKDAKFYGGNGSEIVGVEAFISELESYGNGVVVTYLEDKDGNKTFKVVRSVAGTAPVNNTTTLNTAKITKNAVAVTTATPATATITSSALGTQPLTVNDQTFTYNSAATSDDKYVYNSISDLITKINDAGGAVTATADAAGIKLVGKADGTQFTYRIGSLTPVTTTNGVKEADATKQEITFTFSTAVDVSAGANVTVNGVGGTVASVEAQEVVVTLDIPINAGTAVTTFNVGANPLKSKLTERVVTLGTSVTN